MALQEYDIMAERQSEAREILKDARFEEDQAEAIIATVNLATENLATKDDVEELRGEMQEGFKLLNQRMDSSDERTDNKFAKMDNKIDANANSTNAKLDKMDAKFDKMDAKFDKMDAKFDKNDARFDQIESKFKNLTLRLVAAVVSTIVTLAALYTALTKFFAG